MKCLDFRSKVQLQLTREGIEAVRGRNLARSGEIRISDMMKYTSGSTAMDVLTRPYPDTHFGTINILPDRDGWIELGLDELIDLMSRVGKPLRAIAYKTIMIDPRDIYDGNGYGNRESVTFELFPEEAVDLLNQLVTIDEKLDIDTSDTRETVEDALDLFHSSREE